MPPNSRKDIDSPTSAKSSSRSAVGSPIVWAETTRSPGSMKRTSGELTSQRQLAEFGQDILAQHLDRLHHVVVRDVVWVHQAQQLVDARLFVLLGPDNHFVGIARDH